jgi:hypothetical protein
MGRVKYLFAFLLLTSTALAQVQQWNLQDNAASTTIVAAVGTNGTLVGGDNTSVKSTTGPGGSYPLGLDLNGTDDGIDVSGSSMLFAVDTAWAVSVWVKTDGATFPIMARPASNNPAILKTSDTAIQVRNSAGTAYNFTVPSIGTSAWRHYLVTKTAGNSLRVFVDGTESSTGAVTMAGNFNPETIGYRNGTFGDGQVSGVKVFNTDQAANVATLYAEGSASNVVPIIIHNDQIHRR